MAASPVAVPDPVDDADDADDDGPVEDSSAALDDGLDDEDVLLDDELVEPELLDPHPATTRARVASAATAPVRGAERLIRELRTNDLLGSTGVPRTLGNNGADCVAKGESPFTWRSLCHLNTPPRAVGGYQR